MVNSRNKGAAFEREIAAMLFDLTGITFKRNLEQSREAGHGDLNPDDPAWPFSLELKRYASGTGCKPEWKAQAITAADKAGLIPAVVYKFDRREIRCSVPFAAIGSDCAEWFDCSLNGLAYLAREIMADKAA